MRKIVLGLLAPIMVAMVLIFAGTLLAQNTDKSAALKKVFDFVKSCEYYFIATTDGDQPRVRPFSSLVIFEDKIYFQTGKVKNVSKQLLANPKIEICSYDGKGTWIRIQAVAVNDDRREAKQAVLDAFPELKSMYSADDDNTQVFYLKEVTATLASYSGQGWTETF
jgi:uncharacterized pyridoxamine 5'-phosphate oxidase family protein